MPALAGMTGMAIGSCGGVKTRPPVTATARKLLTASIGDRRSAVCAVGGCDISLVLGRLVNGSDKEEAVTHGNFAWHELYTRDVEAAKAFYAETVGWTFEGMPMPHQDRVYWLAKAGGKSVAGILDMRGIVPDTDPPHWLSYLEVEDVDRMVAAVQSRGGRIVRPPFDIPEFGRIAIGTDGTGAFMAWVTLKR